MSDPAFDTADIKPLSREEKAVLDLSTEIREACDGGGHPKVYEVLARAALSYAKKNEGYRTTGDPMANFRDAPPVIKGKMTVVQYAHTLMCKQDDALTSIVWVFDAGEFEARGGLPMFEERALGGIVYRAILLALKQEEV